MSFEEFKNLTYRDTEPKEKVNTHRMTSIEDGTRFCKWRKLVQRFEIWANPHTPYFDMEIEHRKKLMKKESRAKKLEARKQKRRALKKLWNNFEKLYNSPDTTPAFIFNKNKHFSQKLTPV